MCASAELWARLAAELVAHGRAGRGGVAPWFEAGLSSAVGTIFSTACISGWSESAPALVPAGFRRGIRTGFRALRELTLAGFTDLRLPVFAFGGLAEVFQFFRLELANVSGLDVEDERTVADAADLLDVVADFFEHLAEFSIAALY